MLISCVFYVWKRNSLLCVTMVDMCIILKDNLCVFRDFMKICVFKIKNTCTSNILRKYVNFTVWIYIYVVYVDIKSVFYIYIYICK